MWAQAAVVNEPDGEFEITDIEFGDLREDEVYVKILSSGICHTDIVAQQLTPLPAILGHEGAGIVEEVGRGVKGLVPGDRVIMSYPSCGSCGGCTKGEPYHCDHHMSLGFNGARQDGTKTAADRFSHISTNFFQQSSFSTHSIVQQHNLVKVTHDVDPILMAAIPCGVQTGAGSVLNTFNMNANQSIAIYGAGAVGLSAVMAARLVGAYPIIAVDVVPERLALAEELGATHVVNALNGDVLEKIVAISGGGVDFSLETSANEQALNNAIEGLATAGTCGMVIAPHFGEKYPFSPTEIFKGARTVRGIVQGSSIPKLFLPMIIDLHARGVFPVEKLIKEYRFFDINKAMQDTKNGTAIKPVLVM